MTFLFRIFSGIMLLMFFSIIPVSAEITSTELKFQLPAHPLQPDQTTTVPVMISHTEELLAFTMEIPNNISGVTILINRSMEPLDGFYTINSQFDNQIQYLSWFTTVPITQDNVVLFYLDIIPTPDAQSPITLTVTPSVVGNDDGVDISSTFFVSPATVFILTENAAIPSGQFESSPKSAVIPEKEIDIQTIIPEHPTGDTVSPVSTAGNTPQTTKIPTLETAAETTDHQPVTIPASVSVLGILTGLGTAVILGRRFT